MRFLSIKDVSLALLMLSLLVLLSCKKEVIEVKVDAFAQLNAEVKSSQGVHNILFTLQEYPYKEVGVRLATSKDSFYKNVNITNYVANKVNESRYGVFVNNLTASNVYYYQIYVKDSVTAKEVYSDIFSFKINP